MCCAVLFCIVLCCSVVLSYSCRHISTVTASIFNY
nr:MAG TPA: hypothetical protein [Caudoviricetes sp.]